MDSRWELFEKHSTALCLWTITGSEAEGRNSHCLSSSLPEGVLVLLSSAYKDRESLTVEDEEECRSGGSTCSAARDSRLMNMTSLLHDIEFR